jgi:hypothetical protein
MTAAIPANLAPVPFEKKPLPLNERINGNKNKTVESPTLRRGFPRGTDQ